LKTSKTLVFFIELTDEILRWHHVDFSNVAFECLKNSIVCNARFALRRKLEDCWLEENDYRVALAGEILKYEEGGDFVENFDWDDHNDMINRACHCIIMQSIDAIKQHISFARIIIIDKDGETLFYRICSIPCVFLSGTYATNGIDLAHNALSSMIKFIDSYNFYSTSDQAYSHSERSVCLALSEEFGDYKISDIINDNTVDLCVQIRNLSRMCVNCEHFIFGRDIYFTKVGGKGCFVTCDYREKFYKKV
jgi:hypothetical protein